MHPQSHNMWIPRNCGLILYAMGGKMHKIIIVIEDGLDFINTPPLALREVKPSRITKCHH